MDPCEFQDELGDILRKSEVSFGVLCRHCGNSKLYFRQQYLYLSFRLKKKEADK